MTKVTVTIDLTNVTTEAEYNQAIASAIQDFSQLNDQYFKTQFINGVRALNAGNKGRISVPEFMKKVKPESVGNGKKGRPALTIEQKLEAEQKRFEAKTAKLLEQKSNEEVSA